MARNSLSPGFLKIFYTSNGHPHVQTLPVNPVAPAGAATNLLDKSGASQLWTSAVADLVLIMKAVLHTTDSIDTAEIWTQASPTAVPIFQASSAIGVNGTSASVDQPFSQLRFSFRTSLGGRGVYTVLEGVTAPDQKFPAPLYGAVAAFAAIDAYLTGVNSVVWGRDNAYLSAGIRAVSKTNDTLRKAFLNP